MQMIDIGRTGIRTTPLGLGCARLGSILTPLNASECVDLVALAYDLGIRHFDTAASYGQGDSERHLGAALWKKRDRVCIATKAGQRPSLKQQALSPFKRPIQFLMKQRGANKGANPVATGRAPAQSQPGVSGHAEPSQCFEPAFLEQSLDASLQRLRTDYVDIFYLHAPPLAVLHDPAIHDLAGRLKASGKVRAFGVYCDDAALARTALRMSCADVVEFAASSEARDPLLLRMLTAGKACVLKHIARPAVNSGRYAETLMRSMGAALQMTPSVPFTIGTVNPAHLKENVRLFQAVAARDVAAATPEEVAA